MLDYTLTEYMAGILDILTQMNPWWRGGVVEAGIPREKYLSRITDYLKTGEIVAVNGVRRSGKTTLLYLIIRRLITDEGIAPRRILFVNFDEPGLATLEDPLGQILDVYRKDVCSDEEVYLVFDEVQVIAGWERHLKSLHDRKTYRLIISGSSSSLLEGNLSTLLSGRYLSVPVFPLDFREYLGFNNLDVSPDPVSLSGDRYRILTMLRDYLRDGGFPRVVLEKSEALRQEYLKAYYDSIVYRDIILAHQVRNVRTLKDLLYYLFSNLANLFTYRNLQALFKIDFATLKEFIGYAADARILFEVPYFSYSLKARARNPRKIYCIDNGLRNAVSFRFSEDEGRLAENLVFVELMMRGYEPYYWAGQNEVDFVIRNPDNSLTAINVTYTDAPDMREAKGLQEFSEKFPTVKECILLTKDLEKTDNGIRCVPLWKWLLAGE